MPRTFGVCELIKIDPETETIAGLLGCERMQYTSKADVMCKLEHSNLVHFGCHGEADPLHPRKSCLFVAVDEDRTPERITVEDLIQTNLPDARLAYLSACSTAQSKATELNEETLHLASVFQLIGFPQVIGTVWEAKDWAANRVALSFYTRVAQDMNDSWHHADKFALFLHEAIIETREGGPSGAREARNNLLAWVPFVHMGC
jgi:CHAT domain-containing protein